MSEWIGEKIKLKVFGASHSEHIGMELFGVKKDSKIDFYTINGYLEARKPCESAFSTSRKESDFPIFESGVDGSLATGEIIRAIIKNNDVKKSDYAEMKGIMRPGHADYPAFVKFGADYDMSGGGKFSGRMTAPVCIAGGIAAGILKTHDIEVIAYLSSVGDIEFGSYGNENFVVPEKIGAFVTASSEKKERADKMFAALKEQDDSIGGKIECVVTGLPAGIGDAMFESMESKISSLAFGIPAVKAIEFGLGTAFADKKGSEVRDELYYDGEKVLAKTNFNGGINGGITNGMPLTFRLTVKPTSSIGKSCDTVDVIKKCNTSLTIKGRHDVCIAPRAVPVAASIAALAIYDSLGESL